MKYKDVFNAVCGMVGSFVVFLFGPWDGALATLIILMGVDYITGLILAGVFKKSPKTPNGALESRVGWKGLFRKGITLLIVLVAYRLDLIMHTAYIRDAVIIAFIANEGISIIENAALMGIPVPKPIIKAIEILKEKYKDDTPDESDNE
ncbi:MAG: phage holin family protein [Clostridia bacterium]|nr:phage holin family protein [Clostridia bacterium]